MPLPYDLEFLKTVLLTLLASGGAGALTVIVIERVPFLAAISDVLVKRVVAFALSTVFAGAVWLAAVGMLYLPAPETWRQAIEILASLGALAFAVSQGVHGRATMVRREKDLKDVIAWFKFVDDPDVTVLGETAIFAGDEDEDEE